MMLSPLHMKNDGGQHTGILFRLSLSCCALDSFFHHTTQSTYTPSDTAQARIFVRYDNLANPSIGLFPHFHSVYMACSNLHIEFIRFRPHHLILVIKAAQELVTAFPLGGIAIYARFDMTQSSIHPTLC